MILFDLITPLMSLASILIALLTSTLSWNSSKKYIKERTTEEEFKQYLEKVYKTSNYRNRTMKKIDIRINGKAYDILLKELYGKQVHERQVQYQKKQKSLEESFEVLEKALLELHDSSLKEQEQKQKKRSLALTSLIVKHTSKANTSSYLYLTFSFIVYNLLVFTGIIISNSTVPLLILVLACIIFIRQRILVYRIQTGQYGSNEYEAREVLKFILDETNHHYFNGSGGTPAIFSEDNLKEVHDLIESHNLGGVRL